MMKKASPPSFVFFSMGVLLTLLAVRLEAVGLVGTAYSSALAALENPSRLAAARDGHLPISPAAASDTDAALDVPATGASVSRTPAPNLPAPALVAAVRDILVQEPMIIVNAMWAHEQVVRARREDAAAARIAAAADRLFASPASPSIGTGAVAVVEFLDYRCAPCKTVAPVVAKLVSGRGARVIYKLVASDAESELAARAALAVFRLSPETMPAFHAALLAGPTVNDARLDERIAAAGLDPMVVREAMGASWIDDELSEVRALTAALAITVHPSFVIGADGRRGVLAERLADLAAALSAKNTLSAKSPGAKETM